LFYGNTLFEPVVLEAAFGSKDDVEDGYTLLLIAVRDSLMISLMSLPGYFVTVMLIGRKTCVCTSIRSRSARCSTICPPCNQAPSYIQMQGFILMFLLYLLIGIYWTSLSGIQWLLLLLYAGTFFFANYGPNSTTFLLIAQRHVFEGVSIIQ
jgi:PHS family inorganic phosphate transporter-like MFS transporter